MPASPRKTYSLDEYLSKPYLRAQQPTAGFVDTPLSAALLGDDIDARRDQLRATLPIRRVVGPADVAARAVHIMINETLAGATYDIDGEQQLVAG